MARHGRVAGQGPPLVARPCVGAIAGGPWSTGDGTPPPLLYSLY